MPTTTQFVQAKPRRLQRLRSKGFHLAEASRRVNGREVACVTRPSPWGNPYYVSRYPALGDYTDPLWCMTPLEAVAKFRTWLQETIDGQDLIDRARRELRGLNLACWCAPASPCHADVWLEVANS